MMPWGSVVVLLVLALSAQSGGALFTELVPSASPLQYIDAGTIAEFYFENVGRALMSSALPVDQSDAIAIFISEGVSGFLGGVAVKGIAVISGDTNNKDSGLQNAQFSGLYFGVSGAVSSLAQIAGLSTITVNVLALAIGFLVGQSLKYRSRTIEPQKKRVGKGPSMYQLMRFDQPAMGEIMKFQRKENSDIVAVKSKAELTQTEIAADLTKWFFIYFLTPKNLATKLEDYVFVGAFAGIVSQLVREKRDKAEANEADRERREKVEERRRQKLTINDQFLDKRGRNSALSKAYLRLLGYSSTSSTSTSSTSTSSSSTSITSSSNKSLFNRRPPPVVKRMPRPRLMARQDFALTRFARAAAETATQVLTYEAARRYVMEVAPYFNQAGGLEDFTMMLSSEAANAASAGQVFLSQF
ncbi:hypothetical protein B484DRAFT_448441 [Ochromonadaceae sp. CCMP2298]|nr:hypothetical protein B484DRAFT_448441 [Ochromonadaceae sp. CCMP2298]